ncbi:hypothetical protein H5410_021452, partial [Solanum commersonii]
MPYSLRRLFATLLVYCNPGNPKDLWKKYENSIKNDIQQLLLNHINEVLLSMERNINEFKDIFGNNLLFNVTYPDLRTFYSNPSFITFRIILTTKNDFVDEINDMLIHRFSDDATLYTTIDETIEPNDQCQFEDFLHTLHSANLPPYILTLKKNCPIILLRNLNPTEGLYNGTRLICHDFKSHVISATISSGDFKNKH